MPAVARGGTQNTVTTNHGCIGASTTAGMSSDVIVGEYGVHRQDDASTPHPYPPDPPCGNHTPTLATGSTSVFANGKGIARVGDGYLGVSDVVGNGFVTVIAGP